MGHLPAFLHVPEGTLAALEPTIAVLALMAVETVRADAESTLVAYPPHPSCRQLLTAVLARDIHAAPFGFRD